jgi:hypothetical protein
MAIFMSKPGPLIEKRPSSAFPSAASAPVGAPSLGASLSLPNFPSQAASNVREPATRNSFERVMILSFHPPEKDSSLTDPPSVTNPAPRLVLRAVLL